MNIYFVDLENTSSPGLEGINQLNKDDKVYILYSKNANTVNIHYVKALMKAKADIEFVLINHLGSNALDFQLCSLLGYHIGRFRGTTLNIYIISNDKGYDCVCRGIPSILKKDLANKSIELNISRSINIHRTVAVDKVQ